MAPTRGTKERTKASELVTSALDDSKPRHTSLCPVTPETASTSCREVIEFTDDGIEVKEGAFDDEGEETDGCTLASDDESVCSRNWRDILLEGRQDGCSITAASSITYELSDSDDSSDDTSYDSGYHVDDAEDEVSVAKNRLDVKRSSLVDPRCGLPACMGRKDTSVPVPAKATPPKVIRVRSLLDDAPPRTIMDIGASYQVPTWTNSLIGLTILGLQEQCNDEAEAGRWKSARLQIEQESKLPDYVH